MYILTKHKKKGIEGFKKFVNFIETTPPTKVTDVISVAILEDPVYIKWVLENTIQFNFIATLSTNELDLLFNSLLNPTKTFAYALFKSELIKLLEPKLSQMIKNKLFEEISLTKDVQKSQQHTSQITIIKSIRLLQERRDITPFKWRTPPDKVLKGENFQVIGNEFISNFNDKTPALRGNFIKKLREGNWQHFYPNGQLLAEGVYVLGEKEGPWVKYYKNGKIKSKGNYKENLKDGTWEEFDLDRNLILNKYTRGKTN